MSLPHYGNRAKPPGIFARPNAPYYIVAPAFQQNSGGVRAMHYLCHALNTIGEEAYISTASVNPELRTPVLTDAVRGLHAATGRQPIAIYPEVVPDNPLNAKHVVRYLLAYPGLITNQPIDLQPTDMVYTFGPSLVPDGWQADMLRMPLVDTSIFNSDGVDESRRRGTAVFYNRHFRRGGVLLPITADSIEISFRVPTRSARELAQIFRSVECLYMYEPSTVAFEALLCGCPVVYLTNDISLPEASPWLMEGKGVSWSLDAAEIARAKATVHEAKDVYRKEEDRFWSDLFALVEKTQARATQTTTDGMTDGATGQSGTTRRRISVLAVDPSEVAAPYTQRMHALAQFDSAWEPVWPIRDGNLDMQAILGTDAILVQGFTPGLLTVPVIQQILSLGKPVLYETDSTFDAVPVHHRNEVGTHDWDDSIRYLVRHAHATLVTNAQVAGTLDCLSPSIQILPAAIDDSASLISYGAMLERAIEGARERSGSPVTASATEAVRQIAVYSLDPEQDAAAQTRLLSPLGRAPDRWAVTWAIKGTQFNTDAVNTADVIVFHRFTPGNIPAFAFQAFMKPNKPIIYELDELLDEVPDYHAMSATALKQRERILYAIHNASSVLVPTARMAARYRLLNPNVRVVPSYVDFNRFYRPVPLAAGTEVRIGVSGASLTGPNFALVEPALRALYKRYGSRVKFVLTGGDVPAAWANHSAVERLPRMDDYAAYAQHLRTANLDIALIPLVANEYNECKSAIKWLEYSAAGIATVASDVAGYRAAISDGRNGLLIPESADAWIAATSSLVEDAARRRRLARTAQANVRKCHALETRASVYHETYWRCAHRSTAVVTEPTQTQTPVRGVLLLDAEGDRARIDASLRQLAVGDHKDRLTVVLTTARGPIPESTPQLRYLQAASLEDYRAAVEQVCALENFDWALIAEAGTV